MMKHFKYFPDTKSEHANDNLNLYVSVNISKSQCRVCSDKSDDELE